MREEQEDGIAELQTIASKDKKDFTQFSYEVHDHLKSIKDEVVLFVDAIDQLGNEDQLLWLPRELPSNVKMVISVLNDVKYEEDSKHYHTLSSKKYPNIVEIPRLSDENARSIIIDKLAQYDRTLQPNQLNYILSLYKNVNTPLYLTIACEEARFWRSEGGIAHELKPTQSEIISEYIENLTTLYHHTKALVTAIFGYVYASREGQIQKNYLFHI